MASRWRASSWFASTCGCFSGSAMYCTARRAALFLGVDLGLDDALQAADLFSLPAIDQGPPLWRPALFTDRRHLRANEHAAGRDEHPLVVIVHQRRRDDLAVARGLLDSDHALGAATVARVLDDRRALAVAVFGGGEDRLPLILGDEHRDHALPAIELHAAHAVRVAAHRTHVGLLEANRLAARGEQHDVVLAVGERDADQEIGIVQVHRDDAR